MKIAALEFIVMKTMCFVAAAKTVLCSAKRSTSGFPTINASLYHFLRDIMIILGVLSFYGLSKSRHLMVSWTCWITNEVEKSTGHGSIMNTHGLCTPGKLGKFSHFLLMKIDQNGCMVPTERIWTIHVIALEAFRLFVGDLWKGFS